MRMFFNSSNPERPLAKTGAGVDTRTKGTPRFRFADHARATDHHNSNALGGTGACAAILLAGSLVLPGVAAANEELEQLRREMKEMQQRIDQLERKPADQPAPVPGDHPAPLPTEQTAAAPSGDGAFESKDQSGNDPRDFTSKFMPYYRRTELENNVEVNELTLFGFYAFDKRFGMTYEVPIAKEIDYNDAAGFKKATAGGCPPSGSGGLPPAGPLPGGGLGAPFDDLDCDGDNVGLGDSIFRFFVRPESMEYSFGANNDKNLSIMPTLEFTAPTATDDLLGGEAFILSPGITLAFDFPGETLPFSLGFFAMMNFYDFDAWKDSDRDDTSRARGRWFWMQPLSAPTPEFTLFDTSGLYIMTEFQPVYDFEQEHFSAWIGPEFGKIAQPGHVYYFKPGFGIAPDGDEGDRDWTFEVGYRYFFE